jgi:hypothetical protein
MRSLWRWLALMALARVFSACSSDSSDTPVASCNTLVDDGPSVTITAASAAAPTPVGGAIEDGTYELSAMTLYTDTSADLPPGTLSAVFEITGDVMQQVSKINGSEQRYTTSFTISGISISMVDSCPSWSSETHSLTATPTEYRIYDSLTSGVLEQVYTRR